MILVEILDLLILPEFNESVLNRIENLVTEHNRKYVSLFDDTLKPKHHNLTHYVRMVKFCGPPRKLWCFRFESRHQGLKRYAENVKSRINICHTLAVKTGLMFSNSLLKNDFFSQEISYDISKEAVPNTMVYFQNLPEQLKSAPLLKMINNLKYKNFSYGINDYVLHENVLYKIFEIIVQAENFYFVIQKTKSVLVKKFSAYKILNEEN